MQYIINKTSWTNDRKLDLFLRKLDKMVEIAITSDYNDNVETFQSSIYGRLTEVCASSDAEFPSKKDRVTGIAPSFHKEK